MENKPSNYLTALQQAEAALRDSVDALRKRYSIPQQTPELVQDIMAIADYPLSPNGLTVRQTIYQSSRTRAFNMNAGKDFPEAKAQAEDAIRELRRRQPRANPTRKIRQTTERVWKLDRAADRRALVSARQKKFKTASPHKGRPEKFNAAVVWAFADYIFRIAGKNRFVIGHYGDKSLNANAGGPMLRVLVSAVHWAIIAAWPGAVPGVEGPAVKPETMLTIIKRGNPNATD